VFLGPGDDTLPLFLVDFRRGLPKQIYRSTARSLDNVGLARRDLISQERYLVPNSIVVSRGCPHHCDFCYKDGFYRGGLSFYTKRVDDALAEIETLPGRHLFFLDDNLMAKRSFATALFDGMRGMNRVWQAAATVSAIRDEPMLDKAVDSGLRSLFIGFETLDSKTLRQYNKTQNLKMDYGEAIRRLKERGVMINASFVFGMDGDTRDVFDATVDWAVSNGIETATFHILTPYPGTVLHSRMQQADRLTTSNWNFFDTRHCVFLPKQMTQTELELGYHRAYRRFYSWPSIFRSAAQQQNVGAMLRHLAYTAGWKKTEPLWDVVIRSGILRHMRPLLEQLLDGKADNSAPQRRRKESNRVQVAPSWH
jgi:radical SAM superfamily enzyme YgiQ (UPF0313 family)